jgi:hypothetical protein
VQDAFSETGRYGALIAWKIRSFFVINSIGEYAFTHAYDTKKKLIMESLSLLKTWIGSKRDMRDTANRVIN